MWLGLHKLGLPPSHPIPRIPVMLYTPARRSVVECTGAARRPVDGKRVLDRLIAEVGFLETDAGVTYCWHPSPPL